MIKENVLFGKRIRFVMDTNVYRIVGGFGRN